VLELQGIGERAGDATVSYLLALDSASRERDTDAGRRPLD
jgi:hypothetical protein